MALYPPAIKKLIPPGSNDPPITPIGVVVHVAVSMQDSLYDYFKNLSGGLESDFYVRLDGTCEQYRDTEFEADAQRKGNSWIWGLKRLGFISIETEGMGAGLWTPAQLATIQNIILWASRTHGFPLQVTPAWNQPGVGHHSMFPEWNPNAHTCPGPDRVIQFNQVLRPWLAAGGQEAPLTVDEINAVAAATVKLLLAQTPGSSNNVTVGSLFQRLSALDVNELNSLMEAIKAIPPAGSGVPGTTAAMVVDELVRRLQSK